MSCVRFSVAKHEKTAIGNEDTKPCRSRFHGVDQTMLETTLDRMVRKSVEETLNAMLDAEADEITGATRYERSGERKAYRAGHYGNYLLDVDSSRLFVISDDKLFLECISVIVPFLQVRRHALVSRLLMRCCKRAI